MSRLFAALVGASLAALSSQAQAFDYLEHSYFSDRACLEAQRRLAAHASTNVDAATRYLALSLFCPERWERPYCEDGYKQLEASLNRLEAPPAESGELSITLGDFAALADHTLDYGPIRNMPFAERDGLVLRLGEWLTQGGHAGGVEADVAEDACETDEPIEWSRVEVDLERVLSSTPKSIPADALSPLVRAQPRHGPRDPAGAYSFDNPQFLDLVLRNHDHFGAAAYGAFLGFHTTAKELAHGSCARAMGLSRDQLEDLTDASLSTLEGDALAEAGCTLLGEPLRQRALQWAKRASPDLVDPVRALLAQLDAPDSDARAARLDKLTAATLAVVYLGGGLHYLQDNFSGGHLRVNRAALSLEGARYEHDRDGANGVVAQLATATRTDELVAFGDDYLLGTAGPSSAECDWDALSQSARTQVTGCLLQRQRGLVLAASTAALLEWAIDDDPASACATSEGPRAFVCTHLPTTAVVASGYGERPTAGGTIGRGTLPTPPPPFSYQSLLISTSIDAAGGPAQLGARLVMLSSLGRRANWMRSYHAGLLTTLGQGEDAQVLGEFSFMFHWRWAARFLLHAGPFVFGGLRGLGQEVTPFTGVGPNVGLTALPEGWIRLPLELALSYRVPLTLLDGRYGMSARGVRIEGHRIEISVGLAFM